MMPLARCLVESLCGVSPGLLGQFTFGDVSVANGRETPNSVCSDHMTRNASAARNNEAKGRR